MYLQNLWFARFSMAEPILTSDMPHRVRAGPHPVSANAERDTFDYGLCLGSPGYALRFTPAPGSRWFEFLYQQKWKPEKSPTDRDEAIRYYKLAVEWAFENDVVLSD